MKRALAIVLAATVFSAAGAYGQTLPDGPITIVIPFSAGGTSDTGMRILVDAVQRRTQKTFVIVNKPGGGGINAAVLVKEARPDGLTLRLADIGPDAILPSLERLPYDPLKDFQPISLLMSWDQFLTVPFASNAMNLSELIALGKSRKGGLTYGSQGIGSGGHLLGLMFQMGSGVALTHVPYKGGAPLSVDLAAGRIDMAFTSYREMKVPLQEKQVRILASAGLRRSSLLPDVPTFAELGVANVELSPWFGLVAPAGTQRQFIDGIQNEFVGAVADTAVVKRLEELGIAASATTPEQFGAHIAREIEKYSAIARANTIDLR